MAFFRWLHAALYQWRKPAPFVVRRIVVACEAGTLVDVTPDMVRYYLQLTHDVGPDRLKRMETDGILSVYLFHPDGLTDISVGFIDKTGLRPRDAKTAPDVLFTAPRFKGDKT